jgi:hypothetical protein
VTTELRDPTALRAHPLNATIYGEPDTDPAFVESIREEGIITPLTIDQDDQIISGHRRWQAAKLLSLDRVPVTVRHIADPLDAIRLLIEANRQRTRTYSQLMREADEWAGDMAAQAQARMVEGGRRFGRGMADPDRVAPNGATLSTTDEVDVAAERYNARRNRTFQRARYIWHIATEQSGDTDGAVMVARELVKKLDAGAITVYAAEHQLREAVEATERRAALPPELPRTTPSPSVAPSLPPAQADPWDDPHYPPPDDREWLRPAPVAPTYTAAQAQSVAAIMDTPEARVDATLAEYHQIVGALLRLTDRHKAFFASAAPETIIGGTNRAAVSREDDLTPLVDWFAALGNARRGAGLRRVK